MNEKVTLEKIETRKPVCWHLTDTRFCFGTVVGTEMCTLHTQIVCKIGIGKGYEEANACKCED
jgi:hypothetical protein